MFISKKKWKIGETFYNSGDIAEYIMHNRGYTGANIEEFITCTKDKLLSPFIMKGMRKAVNRIQSAIDSKEKILIYGDYDADGVTGTSVIFNTLKTLGANVNYYVPDRFIEGYGLNVNAINNAYTDGVSLIITVDTGIAAVDEVKEAALFGIDIIITDHHEPSNNVPDAYVILNPKYQSCEYPEANLAGVGVAFKLATALFNRVPDEYLDLVALGTVADLVPLVGENRILVSLGLQMINQNPTIGIQALLETTELKGKTITAGHLGFQLGPRVNASGRLDTAMQAIELLTTTDMSQALNIAHKLDRINVTRQEMVEQTLKQAEAKINSIPDYLNDNQVIVLADESWNHGVIGIVASRLVEKYYRPVLLIAYDGDKGKGSARSIDGLNMFNALQQCHHLLDRYGGHAMAAGLSVEIPKLQELHDKLNEIARNTLSEEDYIQTLPIDVVLNIPEINHELKQLHSIEQLAPFGIGHAQPKVLVSGAIYKNGKIIGKDNNHVKFMFATKDYNLDVLAFQWASKASRLLEDPILIGVRFELVGELSINSWNQQDKPQLKLCDCAISPIQFIDSAHKAEQLSEIFQEYHLEVECIRINISSVERIASLCASIYHEKAYTNPLQHKKIYILVNEDLRQFADNFYRIPNRDDFKIVYKILREHSNIQSEDLVDECCKYGLNSDYSNHIIKIFSELNLAEIDSNRISLLSNPGKNKLENSQLYSQLYHRALLNSKHALI